MKTPAQLTNVAPAQQAAEPISARPRRAFIRKAAMFAGALAALAGTSVSASSLSNLPDDRWPGRLVVGDKTLDDFVAIGEEAHPDASWTVRIFQSASMPTLQIRAQWRTIGAVKEWIPTLVNNSATPSGRVTEVRSLAASWPTRGPVDFYGNNGSQSRIEDFADRTELDIDVVELMPERGKSSDGIFPFFALTDRHDSLAVGIGWSGRWDATLKHADGHLQIEIGLPQVGFVLRPWESVRLPSILLAQAPGKTADQARRLVRAHLTNHVVPKTPDGKSPALTAHGTMYQYHRSRVASEGMEIAALERAAALGFEMHWIDANWYGNEPYWPTEVGNWNARHVDFPRGLRPISDRAHERGMKFIFWMEPERAYPHTEWARSHPDLFLTFTRQDGGPWYKGLILDLGNPRAVDLAFTTISSLITEFNADFYRQDFNTIPLDAWYAEDPPDRVGITEIRYIEGLYALWDRILAAHPDIVIDNCAAGGRRIDLETMRRSVPLFRSDAGDAGGRRDIPKADLINQLHCWGLGHWIPYHGGPIRTFDAYATRSTLLTGFIAYRPLPTDEHDPEYADALAAVAENKRLRPLIAEERIGLIAPSLEKEAWMAFQHHRHSDSSGIIVALRGPEAESDSVTLRPEYIDAKVTYRLTKWNNYRATRAVQVSGAELKEIALTIAETRSSVLLEYQRVD
ncbi:hypothetical protein AXK11_04165 [Cephaloticoccus primus]|uniref:Alpha-galactosidase n=1 Tax=Cephaloticoccus primus TaxID=1548207 RepID=A0A139SQ13_9BACT|nr:glycoside hydrolase family 36 protein [Cephaloticoccus primus]KXU36551.1 hypothetical protein AXK11_04165 [Cephaloticoccus primus]